MEKYHKIKNVFKRDTKTNKLINNEFTTPEFENLKNIDWVCTEKIDGTSIRVIWDGENIEFKGRNENSQIPVELAEKLTDIFQPQMSKFKVAFDNTPVCFYGEGYGRKINGGGKYIKDGVDFILFDIHCCGYWLMREAVEGYAEMFNIDVVPIVAIGNIATAIDIAIKGFKSKICDADAEGLILRPKVELQDRMGNRIIMKIKVRDFLHFEKKSITNSKVFDYKTNRGFEIL